VIKNVRVTNVAIPDERFTYLSPLLRKIYHIKRKMSITPGRKAETYVYLATDPKLLDISRGYWDENNKQVRSNRKSYKREPWKRLWDESERLAGMMKP
jgi:hypothetical protein